ESCRPRAARSCDKSSWMRLKRVVSANAEIPMTPRRSNSAAIQTSSIPLRVKSRPVGRGGSGRTPWALLLALGLGISAAACGGRKPAPASQASVDDLVDDGNQAPARKSPPSSPLVKEAEGLLAQGDAA